MPIDFGDEAQMINEKHLENSLKNRKTLTIPFSGSCLSCGEPIGERRFCGTQCREDYEAKLRGKR